MCVCVCRGTANSPSTTSIHERHLRSNLLGFKPQNNSKETVAEQRNVTFVTRTRKVCATVTHRMSSPNTANWTPATCRCRNPTTQQVNRTRRFHHMSRCSKTARPAIKELDQRESPPSKRRAAYCTAERRDMCKPAACKRFVLMSQLVPMTLKVSSSYLDNCCILLILHLSCCHTEGHPATEVRSRLQA